MSVSTTVYFQNRVASGPSFCLPSDSMSVGRRQPLGSVRSGGGSLAGASADREPSRSELRRENARVEEFGGTY